MEIKNTKFKDLLNRSDFLKTCGRMSLFINEDDFYLNILYDYNNYVFVEFDMDFGTKEFEPLLAKFNKMFQKDHGMKLNIHSHESQNDGDVVEFKVTKSGL